MKAIALRSKRSGGSPGVRLGLALAVSLVLHAAILLPPGLWRSPPAAPAPRVQPLQANLAAPTLATYREEHVAAESLPATLPDSSAGKPAAVPPAPTLSHKPAASPRLLKGRALDTALAALTREEFYPRAAIARGLEGRVVLLLTLDENGTVTRLGIASGSGHALLDEAALKAAGRIGALPGGARQVLLPVEFRLE